jgi:cellulose synthase operon protein C
LNVDAFVIDVEHSSDRAGLLMSGDPSAALSVLLREDPRAGGIKTEGTDAIGRAVSERSELKQALSYCLSDDFFRMRQRIGTSI